MDIYSYFMLFSTISAFLLFFGKKDEKQKIFNKKVFCILSGFFLFIIGALKNTSVGTDSERYSDTFYYLHRFELFEVFDLYSEEWGFYFLIRVAADIIDHHQIMFALASAVFAFSLSYFTYKHSTNPLVSFIMTITMSYFAFSLSGLRQIIAISILLFSFDFIIKRRFLIFLFFIAFAALFHISSVLFLPAYFLVSKEISMKRVIAYISVVPLVFSLRPYLVNFIHAFLYSEYETDPYETSGGWTTLYVYALIIIAALVFKKQLQSQNKNFPFYFSMMYIGTLIQMFVPIQPNIFRVSMYYNIS